jgi:hypothetical protein
MIIALLFILAGFYWLFRETDYLRIRLPVGAIPDKVNRISWDDVKSQYLNRLTAKQTPKWYSNPKTYPPLCGQEWLETTMHVIPETSVQLIDETSKFIIKSDNANALKDAFRVYRNPYLKVKLT